MPLKYLTSCSSSSGKCESCASGGSDVRSKHTDLLRSGIRLSHAPTRSISCQFTCCPTQDWAAADWQAQSRATSRPTGANLLLATRQQQCMSISNLAQRPQLTVALARLGQLPGVHWRPGLGALPARRQLELRAVLAAVAPCAPSPCTMFHMTSAHNMRSQGHSALM